MVWHSCTLRESSQTSPFHTASYCSIPHLHRNAAETRSGFVRAPPWNHPRPAYESCKAACWSGLHSLLPGTVTKNSQLQKKWCNRATTKGASFETLFFVVIILIEETSNTVSFVQVKHVTGSSANPTLNRNIQFNSYTSAISAESPRTCPSVGELHGVACSPIATPKHPWTTFGGVSIISRSHQNLTRNIFVSKWKTGTWNWEDILSPYTYNMCICMYICISKSGNSTFTFHIQYLDSIWFNHSETRRASRLSQWTELPSIGSIPPRIPGIIKGPECQGHRHKAWPFLRMVLHQTIPYPNISQLLVYCK